MRKNCDHPYQLNLPSFFQLSKDFSWEADDFLASLLDDFESPSSNETGKAQSEYMSAGWSEDQLMETDDLLDVFPSVESDAVDNITVDIGT